MDKVPVGTVLSSLDTAHTITSVDLIANLTDPLSVGDKVTFDGWPDEINASIVQIKQKNENVTTATPGKATLKIDKPGFIIFYSNIYKIIGSKQTQVESQSSNWFLDKSGCWAFHLSTTATEFLNDIPSYAKKLIAKYKTTPTWFLTIVVIVALFYIMYPMSITIIAILGYRSLLLFAATFLIIGVPLLYLGLREFSLEQFLASTPPVKIDVATYNLNKMQGKFIPHNTEPLKAPISGLNCVYYFVGMGLTSLKGRPTPLGLTAKGIPALFEDDSGYLAVDLEKATSVDVLVNSIEVKLKQGLKAALDEDYLTLLSKSLFITNTVMPLIKDAEKNKSNIDLSQISAQIPDVNLNPVPRKWTTVDPHDLTPAFNALYNLTITEICLPVNSDYTCIGGVADTGKMLNGKPVKVLVPDRNNGIMMVRSGTAQKITKQISKATYAKIILAAILIIAALGSISLYFSSALAASAAKITTSVTTSIVTTIVPSQSPGYHANLTQSTSIITSVPSTTVLPPPSPSSMPSGSCGNFTLSEPAFSSTTSGICSWNGGTINVSAGGGSSGYISVQIVGADGKEYFNKGTVNWCPGNIGSVYLPAQKYEVYVTSGRGGGSCSSIPYAVAILSTRSIKGII